MPPAKKTIPDALGRAPKKGDTVVAHFLAGDKPRVQQVEATVTGLRNDGTLDLAATLMGRPVTMEAMGPCGGGHYSTGWSLPGARAAAAAESQPAKTDAPNQVNQGNPGPLKPV